MRSAFCSLVLVLLSTHLFKCWWCIKFDAWEKINYIKMQPKWLLQSQFVWHFIFYHIQLALPETALQFKKRSRKYLKQSKLNIWKSKQKLWVATSESAGRSRKFTDVVFKACFLLDGLHSYLRLFPADLLSPGSLHQLWPKLTRVLLTGAEFHSKG